MYAPTPYDVVIARGLAKLVGHSKLFDLSIQSAIRHSVFGGIAFAAVFFAYWSGKRYAAEPAVRPRLLTSMVASAISVGIALILGKLISWEPPCRLPELTKTFSRYLEIPDNFNSFPSLSTALYTPIAAGIYSIDRAVGGLMWAGVAVLIALPRMYVGGHYLTDVVVSLLVGLGVFAVSRRTLEPGTTSKAVALFERKDRWSVLASVVLFGWLLQIAVEFRDVQWVKESLHFFLRW